MDATRATAQLLTETSGRPAALEFLARACARFPHNDPLHQARVEWLRDAGPALLEQYVEAAEALVRINPDAVASAYRGDARLKSTDRAGARDDFRRALEQAPSHAFAAFHLFDLELGDGNLDAALALLESLKTHAGGDYVDAREVQLALARRDLGAASAVLARLCKSPLFDSEWPLEAADKAFVDQGFGREAEAVYDAALEQAGTHPRVGSLWVERRAARKAWRIDRRLRKLRESSAELGKRATYSYLRALGDARQSRRILAAVRRDRRALRADTQTWGITGFCLHESGAITRW